MDYRKAGLAAPKRLLAVLVFVAPKPELCCVEPKPPNPDALVVGVELPNNPPDAVLPPPKLPVWLADPKSPVVFVLEPNVEPAKREVSEMSDFGSRARVAGK